MPVIVSTNCTITRAALSRTSRYVFADSLLNHHTSPTRIGNAARHISPSRTSSATSRIAVPTRVSTAVIRLSKPVSSISSIASTSLVDRLTTRPDV